MKIRENIDESRVGEGGGYGKEVALLMSTFWGKQQALQKRKGSTDSAADEILRSISTVSEMGGMMKRTKEGDS